MITRTPGVARSIRLNVSPENLPPLKSGAATATIPFPAAHHAEEQQPADTESAVVRLGRIQMEDLFAHYHQTSLDDSEFMPLLDTLIGSFARAGLSALAVKELRRHACELYHRCCQDAEPESSFEANMELIGKPAEPMSHNRAVSGRCGREWMEYNLVGNILHRGKPQWPPPQ